MPSHSKNGGLGLESSGPLCICALPLICSATEKKYVGSGDLFGRRINMNV